MSSPTKLHFRLAPEGTAGKIAAWVDVEYGDFLMRGFKVIDDGGKPPWVSMPSKRVSAKQSEAGESTWIRTVAMPDPMRRKAFEEFVLKAWRRECKEAQQVCAKPGT